MRTFSPLPVSISCAYNFFMVPSLASFCAMSSSGVYEDLPPWTLNQLLWCQHFTFEGFLWGEKASRLEIDIVDDQWQGHRGMQAAVRKERRSRWDCLRENADFALDGCLVSLVIFLCDSDMDVCLTFNNHVLSLETFIDGVKKVFHCSVLFCSWLYMLINRVLGFFSLQLILETY